MYQERVHIILYNMHKQSSSSSKNCMKQFGSVVRRQEIRVTYSVLGVLKMVLSVEWAVDSEMSSDGGSEIRGLTCSQESPSEQ